MLTQQQRAVSDPAYQGRPWRLRGHSWFPRCIGPKRRRALGRRSGSPARLTLQLLSNIIKYERYICMNNCGKTSNRYSVQKPDCKAACLVLPHLRKNYASVFLEKISRKRYIPKSDYLSLSKSCISPMLDSLMHYFLIRKSVWNEYLLFMLFLCLSDGAA